ncbi:MAG: class I SAM-dependent methyltransferase [Vicingaceae bacterium]
MKFTKVILIFLSLFSLGSCQAQEKQAKQKTYIFKSDDPNGIGKWYMGREIAHVMGYRGMAWLERNEREKEENTSRLIQNMNIQPHDVIADIGAGSGYHVFKMAPLAGSGLIYAVDIQQEMLDAIAQRQKQQKIENIKRIKGEEQSANLPANSVDKVLMVDVYHEFSYPKEMLQSIQEALKPEGKIYLIEYRMEDPKVPIKRLHKMTEKQAVKEFTANGFQLIENIDNLPWQHCMVFEKK